METKALDSAESIIDWVKENNPFCKEALVAFEDAIKCYEAGVYRPAFLISYIAFQLELKNRILDAKDKPESVDNKKWTNLRDSMNNPDFWESNINGQIKTVNESVFNIHKVNRDTMTLSGIQTRMENFRHLRNQCAHHMESSVGKCTVDDFYNFLKDYLHRFSMAPKKKSPEDYSKEIHHIFMSTEAYKQKPEMYIDVLKHIEYDNMSTDEQDKLWYSLHKLLQNDNKNQPHEILLWVLILKSEFVNLKATLMDYLVKDTNLLGKIFWRNDDVIKEFAELRSQFMRSSFKSVINQYQQQNNIRTNEKYWTVLVTAANCCRNDQEAIENLFSNINSSKVLMTYEPTVKRVLVEYNVFDQWRGLIINLFNIPDTGGERALKKFDKQFKELTPILNNIRIDYDILLSMDYFFNFIEEKASNAVSGPLQVYSRVLLQLVPHELNEMCRIEIQTYYDEHPETRKDLSKVYNYMGVCIN